MAEPKYSRPFQHSFLIDWLVSSLLIRRLKEIRQARNLAQEDFAACAGLSKTKYGTFETGKTSLPALEDLRAISRGAKLTNLEWLSLLTAWIEVALGPDDYGRLHVTTSYVLHESPPDLTTPEFVRAFQTLTEPEKTLVLELVRRPDLLSVVRELVKLHDKLNRE